MVKSSKPGKQRKAQYNASMHTKRKRVSARLQLDKPDERFAGVRSVTVRAGDTVRVMECRPLSKTVSFCVIEKTGGEA